MTLVLRSLSLSKVHEPIPKQEGAIRLVEAIDRDVGGAAFLRDLVLAGLWASGGLSGHEPRGGVHHLRQRVRDLR
ncbi:hypothetical protein [Allorhizocola rhizosphaerae]|uniref:hypothetical protein n=1 Tax=Allorhizocola rhizosphaerae TaxID=1872709 RepID=UPI000E3C88C4|nr:hypothetical protein [Allorhizocola rhizosphaerae]